MSDGVVLGRGWGVLGLSEGDGVGSEGGVLMLLKVFNFLVTDGRTYVRSDIVTS